MNAPTDERHPDPVDAGSPLFEPETTRAAASAAAPEAASAPAKSRRAKTGSRKRAAPAAATAAPVKRKPRAASKRAAAQRRRKPAEDNAPEPVVSAVGQPAASADPSPAPGTSPPPVDQDRLETSPPSPNGRTGMPGPVPHTRPLSPYRALLRSVHRWLPDPMGRLERVRTAGDLPLDGQIVAGPNLRHAEPYRPSPRALVRRLLGALPGPLEQTTFVDIGSGRGRVIFEAASLPFARVVGIEFAEALHEDATLNLRHWPRARMRCRDVDFVWADALEAPLPAGDLAVYMFDPFDERMTLRMAARLAEHGRAARVSVILVGMRNLTVFRESSAFTELPLPRPLSVWLALFSPYPVRIFEARPH